MYKGGVGMGWMESNSGQTHKKKDASAVVESLFHTEDSLYRLKSLTFLVAVGMEKKK